MSTEEATYRALSERLQRIESRVVRGFEELGVSVTDDDWCKVDNVRLSVSVRTPGRSLRAIRLAIKAAGGYSGVSYDVIVKGESIATVKGE